jgi:hypothetical protein
MLSVTTAGEEGPMSIQLGALIIALGVALAVLVAVAWRRHLRRLNDETPQERYRRDCQAFRREREARVTARPSEEVWAAGTDGSPSRGKQAVAWVTIASIGGCGGCGGCGCGG